MDKAEKRALEVYPVKNKYYIESNFVPTSRYDGFEYEVRKFEDENFESREKFIEGYRMAEKDLELTWEDMECIIKHYQDIMAEKSRVFVRVEDYQEVLERFKDYKERKDGGKG